MFYKYRVSDNRITASGPDQLTADGTVEEVVELPDETAHHDPTQTYRVTAGLDAVEVDPTYVEPPYEIPDATLRAGFEVLVEEANRVRSWLDKPLIDWQDFKDQVKAKQ